MKTNDALYPIREVSKLTGVNSITLRAWERRYGLIEPVRTDGGHRLYTLEHIERIKAAVKLTEEGIPISQVKTRLNQAVPKVKQELSLGEYNYLDKLVEAVHSFDLDSLSTELDQLFMDVSDSHLLSLLKEATQKITLSQSDATRFFWESQVLPRLYTRLRFVTRHLALHACKKLWLQANDKNDTLVLSLLAAIQLAELGYYCVIANEPQKSDIKLLANVKAAKCEGVVVVDENGHFDKQVWQAWVLANPGLEFHYFVEDADKLDLGNVLQCHAHNL